MGFLLKCAAFVACLDLARAHAGLARAPEPVVTPAAIVARDDFQTLGWYSSGVTGVQTSYAPWVFDADTITYTYSGNYFRRCLVSTNCIMFTSCSSGFVVAPTTSSYCGVGGVSSGSAMNYCSSHVLLPTLGAVSGAQSWYWCDKAPITGLTFYAKQPAQSTQVSASATQTTSASSLTSFAGSTLSPTSSSPTATETNPVVKKGSNTPVGAIAGGVVGGVAVLGVLVFAILYTIRRDKRKKGVSGSYQPAPHSGSQPLYGQGYASQLDSYASTAYQSNEEKPQGIVQGNYFPQAYPQGPYDPHVSQQYASNVPLQELSAPLENAPQELPAQQKAPR